MIAFFYKRPFETLLALSVAVLATVFIAEYGFNLKPCALCIWQRWFWVGSGGLALIGMIDPLKTPAIKPVIHHLIALVLLAGAGLAFYHAGVEYGFLPGPSGCSGPVATPQSVTDLLSAANTTRVVPCDQAAFVFLGISMAGYNGLLSLATAIFAYLSRKQV